MWIIGGDYHPKVSANRLCEYGRRRVRTTPTGTGGGGGAVLPQSGRSGGACGDGGQRACALVRTLAGGTGVRVVEGKPGSDAGRGAAPAEDRCARRRASAAALWSGPFEKLRVWVGPASERDVRQRVLHRHRLVQMRTRVKNQLRAVALNEGMARKPGCGASQGKGSSARGRCRCGPSDGGRTTWSC